MDEEHQGSVLKHSPSLNHMGWELWHQDGAPETAGEDGEHTPGKGDLALCFSSAFNWR